MTLYIVLYQVRRKEEKLSGMFVSLGSS